MFEYMCIFTTGGVVLWYRALCEMKGVDILMNLFIKNILLEEKTAKTHFSYQDCIVKWKVQNDLQLVFAIIYKEILQLKFVDELLEMVREEFVVKIHPLIPRQGSVYITLPG